MRLILKHVYIPVRCWLNNLLLMRSQWEGSDSCVEAHFSHCKEFFWGVLPREGQLYFTCCWPDTAFLCWTRLSVIHSTTSNCYTSIVMCTHMHTYCYKLETMSAVITFMTALWRLTSFISVLGMVWFLKLSDHFCLCFARVCEMLTVCFLLIPC